MNQIKKPTVLLLGVTGQLGKLIAEELVDSSNVHLRVATRQKQQIPEFAKRYGEAVFVDLDDPGTFAEALQNVDKLFLLTGYTVGMVTQSKNMIDAAKKAGVSHLVHLGVFSPKWDCTDPHFGWHQMIEVYIKHSRMKWTFLHPNCFMQNMTGFSLIRNGKFRWYAGQKPCGWIALEDVAAAAAKILSEEIEKHHEKDYWFSTEALTINQVAAILSEVIQKPIIPEERLPEQFLEDMGMASQNVDPYLNSVIESFKQISDERMSYIGDVRDDMPKLVGRQGLSFRDWAKLHKTELQAL